MTVHSLRVPRLAVIAAGLGFLYDAPHLLFDSNYATASDHPLYVFHAAMGILTMIVLALTLASVVAGVEGRVTGWLPTVAGLITLTGLMLAAGGIWGEGFMIPYLADIDPTIFADDVGGYLLAIIVLGALLFSTGWVLMAVVLQRAQLLSTRSAAGLGAGAVIAFLPVPMTTFVFVAVLAAVAQGMHAAAPAGDRSLLATV